MPDTLGDDMASTFYVVSVSGLTANPIYGQTAQIGKPLYASAHYFSKTAPTSVGWQWCDGAGEIAGATGAAYTPAPGDNLETLYPRAIPGGSYASRRGPAHTVRFAVPELAGVLPDVSYVTGSGAQTVDASTGFSGDDLTYSLSTSVPGVSIDSGTGIVTIQTGSDASGPVTITAANSGGMVRTGFDVSISATATAPAQMEKPTVTANGSTSLKIDMAADPDDGGSPITSYDIRWREEGGTFENIIGVSDPAFLTGLKPGTTYHVKTCAVNAIGQGLWSKQGFGTTTNAATATAPAQMEKPTVTANGSTSLKIDMAADPDDGGSPITSYDIRWREEGGTFENIIGVSDPAFLTGLKPGTTYHVKTCAVNAIGQGLWSKQGFGTTNAAANPDLPKLVPNADGTIDIKVDEGTFTVTVSGSRIAHHNGTHGPFTAADLDSGPISIVGPIITEATLAGETLAAEPDVWVHESGDAPTIVGQWLREGAPIYGETGTTYTTVAGDVGAVITYRETATNTAGSRSADSNRITVTATTAPAQMPAPTLAVDSASRITATLTADPDDGGSAITSYDLRYSTDEVTWTDLIGVTSTRAITGLTASTRYYVQTRAVNGVGPGAFSISATATTDAASALLNFMDDFTTYTIDPPVTIDKQAPYTVNPPSGMVLRDNGATRVVRAEGNTAPCPYTAQTVSDDREVTATMHAVQGSMTPLKLYLYWVDASNYYMVEVSPTGVFHTRQRVAGTDQKSHDDSSDAALVSGDKVSISHNAGTVIVKKNTETIRTTDVSGTPTFGSPAFEMRYGAPSPNYNEICEFTVKEL